MSAEVKIYLDNVYARLEGVDKETERVIWDTLSFELEVYNQEYTQRRHLYNRKTKKTYAGLLPYVEEILLQRDWSYEVVDTRTVPAPNASWDLVPAYTARPYQAALVDRCQPREVVMAATGAGKTYVLAAIIAKFNVKPLAVFADKLGLCVQLRDELERFLGVRVGFIGDGSRDIQDITVCSLQSALKEEEFLKGLNCILVDECFVYDTPVQLADGTSRLIGELVNERSDVKVLCYDEETGLLDAQPIISHRVSHVGAKTLLRFTITQEDGTETTFTCTEEHPIWVPSLKSYVPARMLQVGQGVFTV